MIIFPVRTIHTTAGVKKVPAIPKGQTWQTYDGMLDLHTYENFGVVIPEGVVVIDLDTHKGVTKEKVEAALNCKLDWQLLQKTISGGEHYAFRVPDNMTLRQGSDLLDVTGFDTRCAGRGWICSGEGYSFDEEVYNSLEKIDRLPMLPRRAAHSLQGARSKVSDDLMSVVVNEPLEGVDEVRCQEILHMLPENEAYKYDSWLRVGMALHHQSQGKKWGIKLWNEWSKKAPSYDIRELKRKWRSFDGASNGKPITMATLIKRAESLNEQSVKKADTPLVDPIDPVTGQPIEEKVTGAMSFVQCAEFAQGEPPEWLIKGLLAKGEINCIFGPPGSGKTFLALDMCLAIAQGLPWRGHRVEARRVAYVAAEGSRGVSLRLQAYSAEHCINPEQLEFFVSADCPNMLSDESVGDVLDAIEAVGGVELVVLDTLAQCSAGGDENSGKDMGRVLGACKRIHATTGATVLVIHHSGKDTSRGARGWSGLRGALDTEISVEEKDGCKIAKVTKQKDGEMGQEYCFGLKPVVLGVDKDGDDISSCVVVEAERQLPPVEFSSKFQSRVYEYLKVELPIDGSNDRIAVNDIVGALIDEFELTPSGKDTRKSNIKAAIAAVCKHPSTVYDTSDDWVFFK